MSETDYLIETSNLRQEVNSLRILLELKERRIEKLEELIRKGKK